MSTRSVEDTVKATSAGNMSEGQVSQIRVDIDQRVNANCNAAAGGKLLKNHQKLGMADCEPRPGKAGTFRQRCGGMIWHCYFRAVLSP